MKEQKQKGRGAAKDKFASVNITLNDLSSFEISDSAKTEFTGYDELKSEAKIIGYKREGGNDLAILNKTPFYVEAGGQIDDLSYIILETIPLTVIDVTKVDNKTIHVIENDKNKPVSTGR